MPKNATVLMVRHAEKPTAGDDPTLAVPGQVAAQPTAASAFHPIEDALFLAEVARQHASTSYLHLLAAPPTPAAVAKLRGAGVREGPARP